MGSTKERRLVEWYTLYQRDTRRFLFRRMRNKEDVKDVLQEVWLRTLRVPEGLVVDEPQAYLYGIAQHVLADWRIDEQKREELVVTDSDAVEEAGEVGKWVDPDDIWQKMDMEKRLREVLASLPETHAAIVILFCRDGMSYVEVAERLNVSEYTVEKYLTQAKALVRTGRRMYGEERNESRGAGPCHDRGGDKDDCKGAG